MLKPSSSGRAELEAGVVAVNEGVAAVAVAGIADVVPATAVTLLLGGGALSTGLDAAAADCSSAACAAGIPRPSLRGGAVEAADVAVAEASFRSAAARCRRKYTNGTASAAEVTAS